MADVYFVFSSTARNGHVHEKAVPFRPLVVARQAMRDPAQGLLPWGRSASLLHNTCAYPAAPPLAPSRAATIEVANGNHLTDNQAGTARDLSVDQAKFR